MHSKANLITRRSGKVILRVINKHGSSFKLKRIHLYINSIKFKTE